MQRASSPKSPPSWCRSGKFTRTSLRGFPLIKRMTLLAKKEAMSVTDFRAYWAGPHAKLALGMEGIPNRPLKKS